MAKLKLPNIDDVVAIDIHTHAEELCGMHGDDGYDDSQSQMSDYLKSPHKQRQTVPEAAAYYRSKKIAAVIFPVDAERETGFRRYNNYEMLEVASEHLDVLIPFISIDPHKGKLGVREAKKLIEEYGVRGFKFHPTMQGFYANDRMAYPLYEAINEGGAIALFHTGQTGVEQRDRAALVDGFIERIGHAVVGVKTLHGRMEFETADAVFLDQLLRLAHAELALVRVDADEGDQDVEMFGGDFQHLVIVVAAKTGLTFGVDRKDHGRDFLRAVIGRGFRHRRRMLVRRLEIVGHLRLEIVIAVVAMHAAGLFGMGMDVDRHDVFDIGQFQLGHLGSRRLDFWVWEIDYTI